MKRVALFLILCVLLAQAAFAQHAWTVRTVPNTRLESDLIHVSDPDGYLSDSTESYINEALSAIRDRADVFVVTLYSIGDDEPKHFATALFNYWGIGDAETDNGVLLLFVEEQRALEFETGYGAEATLTDAECSWIFNQTIVPYFKAGDYEGGLCAGVADIVEVYGGVVPDGLMSNIISREGDYDDYSDGDGDDMSTGEAVAVLFFLAIVVVVPIISFLRWITGLLAGKKKNEVLMDDVGTFEEDGFQMIDVVPVKWTSSVWEGKGFLRFLVYGVGAVACFLLAMDFVPQWMPDASVSRQDFWTTILAVFGYLTGTSLIQNSMLLAKAKKVAKESRSPKGIYDRAKGDAHSVLMRVLAPWVGIPFGMILRMRKKNSVWCVCPTCGADLVEEDGLQLPEKWAAEEAAGAYRYTSCSCPSGHRFVVREQGASYSSVERCQSCGVLASTKVKEVTTVSPSYTDPGTKEITYECQYCHAQRIVTQSIPKLVRSTSSSSSGRSYSSSSHSHGSFGGGHSGGGGYSGRW